jgi:hypothetical protein
MYFVVAMLVYNAVIFLFIPPYPKSFNE